MKNLRKIMIAMITVVMTISMAACGSESPTKVLDKTLSSIKSGEEESIAKIINSSTSGAQSSESEEKIIEAIKKIEYKINSETIEGDNAKVNVTLSGPDLTAIMTKYMEQAFSDAFSQAFSGETMTDEEKKEKYDKMLGELIENSSLEERTMDINLVKENKEWTIKDEKELVKLVLNMDNSAGQENTDEGSTENDDAQA